MVFVARLLLVKQASETLGQSVLLPLDRLAGSDHRWACGNDS